MVVDCHILLRMDNDNDDDNDDDDVDDDVVDILIDYAISLFSPSFPLYHLLRLPFLSSLPHPSTLSPIDASCAPCGQSNFLTSSLPLVTSLLYITYQITSIILLSLHQRFLQSSSFHPYITCLRLRLLNIPVSSSNELSIDFYPRHQAAAHKFSLPIA